MNEAKTHPHDTHADEPHAAPMWVLIAVFGGLLVLTVVTVLTGKYVDLGEYNLLFAMVIAVLKGTLVALFFMHLWWDSLFNSIALVAGLAFLALFIGFSVMDTYQYQPTVLPLNQVLTTQRIAETSRHEPHAAAGAHRADEAARHGTVAEPGPIEGAGGATQPDAAPAEHHEP